MLGIDYRAARAAWTVFLLALLIATAYAIRATLVVLAVSLLFAYMLAPIVGFVERYTPRRVSPTVALTLVYLALTGALVGFGLTIGSRIADEASLLANRLPDLVRNRSWVDQLPLPQWLEPARERIVQAIQTEFDTGGKDLLPYLKDVWGQLLSASKYILDVVLVPILAFFFLKDGAGMREALVDSFVDASGRPMVEDILSDINRLLGQYIRALVLLSFSSFVAYSLFLAITGAPYAVLLACIAAALDFIPVVGPLAAGLLVALVTGLSGYTHLVWLLIFWILFRLFQDYILSPHLMSAGVELNPMLVLFGVLAGERIAGIAGIFFSIPVLATLRVIFVRLQRVRRTDNVARARVEA
jgi:predicted PurR-regulated permease PerM